MINLPKEWGEYWESEEDFFKGLFSLDVGTMHIEPETLRLFLIDLHRVQIRKSTPWKWRVKDISALLFSSMDTGLSKDDLALFAKHYHSTTAEKSMTENRIFWWLVKRRATKLYKKQFNILPSDPDRLYG